MKNTFRLASLLCFLFVAPGAARADLSHGNEGFFDTADHFARGGSFEEARRKLHDTIIASFLAGKVKSSTPIAYFTAGLPGAGKSTVLKTFTDAGLLALDELVLVDPDAIREWIPEYQFYKAAIPALAAELTHKEAVEISRALIEEAVRRQLSLLIDTSFTSTRYLDFFRQAEQSAGARYSRRLIAVSAETEILKKRIAARAKETGRGMREEIFAMFEQGFRDMQPRLQAGTDFEEAYFVDNSRSPQLVRYLNKKSERSWLSRIKHPVGLAGGLRRLARERELVVAASCARSYGSLMQAAAAAAASP